MPLLFEELGLSPELVQAVSDMGFEEPSPIQALAIPTLLEGRDALGQAHTGTGKTAAFGIPALERTDARKCVQVLVLCPTRELAIQVAEELSKLAARKRGIFVLPIYGGQPIERQFRALERGAQVVVGTPGRVIDHLQRGTLKLDSLFMAVLDEADEMLDMGFREDIETIMERAPESCQRVLFSATMPPAIRDLANRFLRDPEVLAIAAKTLTVPAIKQVYYEVRPHQKMDALARVLDAHGFHKALVFCSTRRTVDEVAMHLQSRGYQADGLHGNMAQPQRDRVMSRFRSGTLEILVATDVAARGLDVDDVDAVINYDIFHDTESYVHRIGRTGRAGRAGSAFTFVTMRERHRLRDIIRTTKAKITLEELPTLRDVNALRTTRLMEEVRGIIEAGALERCTALVDQYLDDGLTSMDMAAALLKLLMRREFGEQAERDELEDSLSRDERPRRPHRDYDDRDGEHKHRDKRGPRPEEENMTRLRFNVGHNNRVTPRELVGAITGEAGIPGKAVGAIDIRHNFSLVDIADHLADDVMLVLNGNVRVGGITVQVHRDGRGSGAPYKPGLGAPRRAGQKKPFRKSGGKTPPDRPLYKRSGKKRDPE